MTSFWLGLGIIAVAGFLVIWAIRAARHQIAGFFSWIKRSFEENGNASAKKISAFWFVVLVTVLQLRYLWYSMRTEDADRFEHLMDIIYADLFFIGACLGIKALTEIAGRFGKQPAEPPPQQPPSP